MIDKLTWSSSSDRDMCSMPESLVWTFASSKMPKSCQPGLGTLLPNATRIRRLLGFVKMTSEASPPLLLSPSLSPSQGVKISIPSSGRNVVSSSILTQSSTWTYELDPYFRCHDIRCTTACSASPPPNVDEISTGLRKGAVSHDSQYTTILKLLSKILHTAWTASDPRVQHDLVSSIIWSVKSRRSMGARQMDALRYVRPPRPLPRRKVIPASPKADLTYFPLAS